MPRLQENTKGHGMAAANAAFFTQGTLEPKSGIMDMLTMNPLAGAMLDMGHVSVHANWTPRTIIFMIDVLAKG